MYFELVNTILYDGKEGPVCAKLYVDDKYNIFWASQKMMGELFEKDITTISKHLRHVFESEELVKEEVTFNPNDSSNGGIIINPDAKRQPILYNLDAIISVGYRVKSKQAIYFRRWATRILKDYIIKGFALDVEQLKNNADDFDRMMSDIKKMGCY